MKNFLKLVISILIISFILGKGITFYMEKMSTAEDRAAVREQIVEGLEEIGNVESIYDINDQVFFDEERDILEGNIDKFVIEAKEPIQKLEIELGGGSLSIVTSKDDLFYFEGKDADQVQIYMKDHVLRIKAMKTKNYDLNMKLTLYVPDDYSFQEMEANIGAGVMEAEKCFAEKLKIELGAGKIELENIHCSKLEASVGAGHLKLQDFFVEEYAEVVLGAGHIEGTGIFDNNADLTCSMGAIHLHLQEKLEEHDYSIQCAAGKVQVGEKEYSTLSSQERIENGAENQIDVHCSLGSITINFI